MAAIRLARALQSLALAACALPMVAAAQVTHRPSALVDRDQIVLADLFDRLPASTRGDAEVMRAPAPGQRLALDATTLASIAQTHGVRWQPVTRAERVSIERTATVLGVEQLRPAVGPALVARGLPPGADFAFDNPALKVMVPTGGDPSVAVEQMTYDGRQRFVATLVIGDDPATAERLRLTGRVFQTIDAVVLTRPIQPGDVIRARDLEVIRVRAEQAGAAVIRDPARMIGRTVRRTLLAGQPIRGQDLAPVLWVQRNSLVTVKVDSSRIAIAMQGKALDDGAEGDRVRVINTRSDKTIQGIVTGPGEVTVQSVYAIATR